MMSSGLQDHALLAKPTLTTPVKEIEVVFLQQGSSRLDEDDGESDDDDDAEVTCILPDEEEADGGQQVLQQISIPASGGSNQENRLPWTVREVEDFIPLWRVHYAQIEGMVVKKPIFEQLEMQMKELGHIRSADQCQKKIQSFKDLYKKTTGRSAGRSGKGASSWKYFKAVEDILRGSAWDATASATLVNYTPKKSGNGKSATSSLANTRPRGTKRPQSPASGRSEYMRRKTRREAAASRVFHEKVITILEGRKDERQEENDLIEQFISLQEDSNRQIETMAQALSSLVGANSPSIDLAAKATMSADPNLPSLGDVVSKLDSFGPLKLAESWDNVGLLIQGQPLDTKIKTILLTNDLTESVAQEAVDERAGLIISYHPPIFSALKRITQNNWKERVVASCLSNNVAVYSPHTCWDAVKNGVNDWLTKAFDTASVSPITTPECNELGDGTGMGRCCTLRKPVTIAEAIKLVKSHLQIKHVRVALATSASIDSPIRTVGVCAGSGSTVLRSCKCDLFVTGEMSHHDVLDATHRSHSVILCEHSNTERGFLTEFAKVISSTVGGGVNVVVSKKDCDPLIVM